MTHDELELLWSMLPPQKIELRRLVWPSHGIVESHLTEKSPPRAIDSEAIRVEQLVTGHYFIHDGRHRSIRAKNRGDTHILAHVLTHL